MTIDTTKLRELAQKLPEEVLQELMAENTSLRRSLAAAKMVIELQELIISRMRSTADLNNEAVTTLDSERAANAAMTDEVDRLRTIEAAARNLVKVKGRHHAEIAYQKLVEALK